MRNRPSRPWASVFIAASLLQIPPVWASPEPFGIETEPASHEAQTADHDRRDVRYSVEAGLPLLAGAVASVVLPGKTLDEPPACLWCNGANPGFLDRWGRKAKWQDPCRAGRLSYWTLGAAGLTALGPMSYESDGKEWLENVGGVVDSVSVTLMLTQAVKYAVRRERPSPTQCHPDRTSESDRNLSFFSGHAAIAFALASSAHEMGRLRGRPRNEWLLLAGASAATTGYLRIAGDRHHLIDVVAGAGVGYLVGKWVPRHFDRIERRNPKEAASLAPELPSPGAPLLGYTKVIPNGERAMLLQLGKGPGKSLQLGLSF